MSNIFSTDTAPESQEVLLEQGTVLEANREFRDEILAFKAHELLSGYNN